MSDLENFFNHCSRMVDARLDGLIPPATTQPSRLYEAVRWSVFAGGKRFRPALVLAVGEAFGAREERLLSMAAAVEMIHTYSLIHDDLPAMDDDDLRRGRATCHVKFTEATAILAGDVLQTLAFQAIAVDSLLTEKTRVRLIAELAASAARMIDGQQLDLDGEGRKITLEDLEKIHQNKTGAMISVAARGGAIIADAGAEELNAVTNYASRLGLLFQITDDLLDVTQPTEVLGKTAGKDLTAEKATYPAFYGIEETRARAEKVYGEAIDELNRLARPTAILREIAAFILDRES
ncbi:MAG TPA: farnesyl diphosphate synthase [Pyrinomonadaceae bacterium]|jgi:geranylgeranyl pyrophosphate synthase